MAIIRGTKPALHDTGNCPTCSSRPPLSVPAPPARSTRRLAPKQDIEYNLHVCRTCVDAIEFTDEEIGAAPGTLAQHRRVMLAHDQYLAPVLNGTGTISASTYRGSDGTYESVPAETFSTAPCHGCGSFLAGERHPYDIFIPAEAQ